MSNDGKVLLVDDIDVLVLPQCQHKSHIEKIMFITAMARPRMLPDGTWFDGKIGIWPCTEDYTTKRRSKHGPKGTVVQINKNVDGDFYHHLFVQPGGIFDAIEQNMHWMVGQTVVIQQDGAKPHTGEGTIRDLELAGSGEGWTMKFITQSSQSPDVNINDLGFFNSLNSRVREIQAYTTEREEMMQIVQLCFNEYPMDKLDGIWGCLFNNFRSIMACDGGNQYPKAHNGGRLRRLNTGTSVDLTVNMEDYLRCRDLCNL